MYIIHVRKMKRKKQCRSNEADQLTIEDVIQLGGDQVDARIRIWIWINNSPNEALPGGAGSAS